MLHRGNDHFTSLKPLTLRKTALVDLQPRTTYDGAALRRPLLVKRRDALTPPALSIRAVASSQRAP